MIQENNQKIIIVSLAFFLLASFVFLSCTERQQHQLNDGWFLYFENPKDNSLNFTIENYTDNPEFEWKLSADNDLIKSEKINIKSKEKKAIEIGENDLKGKVKIEVKQEGNEKQIYKIISNSLPLSLRERPACRRGRG